VLLKDKNTSLILLRRLNNNFKELLDQTKMNRQIDKLEGVENTLEIVTILTSFVD
jgi:hypothetical protein